MPPENLMSLVKWKRLFETLQTILGAFVHGNGYFACVGRQKLKTISRHWLAQCWFISSDFTEGTECREIPMILKIYTLWYKVFQKIPMLWQRFSLVVTILHCSKNAYNLRVGYIQMLKVLNNFLCRGYLENYWTNTRLVCTQIHFAWWI